MGTSWSQEQEDSFQQTQPPLAPSSPNSLNIKNSIGNDEKKQEEKGCSQQFSQPTIIPSRPQSFSNNSKEIQQKVMVNNKLPHNFEAIFKESDSPIDTSSLEKLYERLHTGIYLNGRKKKYWVEQTGNINCFLVFANGLSITWSEENKYWQWHHVETNEGKMTVAMLRNVCWLEVHGRFHTSNLTPGVTYQVAYIIKFEYSSYGWEVPVNLRLILPNGSKQERKECFKDKQRDEWIRVPVGEFKVSHDIMGEIEFSLYEYEGGSWKKGLVIKGVTIEPKVI